LNFYPLILRTQIPNKTVMIRVQKTVTQNIIFKNFQKIFLNYALLELNEFFPKTIILMKLTHKTIYYLFGR